MTKHKVDYEEHINEGSRRVNETSVPIVDMESTKIVVAEDFVLDELLPSIPNDLTLHVIALKSSARDINILSLVSPTWQEAIHRRWVYDARVRSHSTETFVVRPVIVDRSLDLEGTRKLRLYSLHDNSAYDLPPVPRPRFQHGRKCISLDGKLYMLGGCRLGLMDDEYFPASREVFMLDLAGQRPWKQCASMQEPRHHFSAGVLDGKIYVFGGSSCRKSVCKSEMYDPKIDAWSSIADIISYRTGHQVAAAGGELFVYSGTDFDFPQDLIAYHPDKNEWRQIVHPNSANRKLQLLSAFVAQGKFHTITRAGIDVYDIETNSWSGLHLFSGLQDNSGEFLSSLLTSGYRRLDVLPLGDEILILRIDQGPRCRLVQSRGFGSKDREVALEEIRNCRLSSDLREQVHVELQMCLIQL